MSLAFERLRGKTGPKVEAELREWLAATSVESIEDVTVHVDATGWTVYSVFYWTEE